jgi:hypothetical protein
VLGFLDRRRIKMRQPILSAFTACALLGAATIGMPAAAEAQTVIIINGNQPYYPQSYPDPYPHRPVVYAPDYYYGAGYGYYGAGYGYYGAGYGYYNGYDNGYTNGGCYTNCYPRPYRGW